MKLLTILNEYGANNEIKNELDAEHDFDSLSIIYVFHNFPLD